MSLALENLGLAFLTLFLTCLPQTAVDTLSCNLVSEKLLDSSCAVRVRWIHFRTAWYWMLPSSLSVPLGCDSGVRIGSSYNILAFLYKRIPLVEYSALLMWPAISRDSSVLAQNMDWMMEWWLTNNNHWLDCVGSLLPHLFSYATLDGSRNSENNKIKTGAWIAQNAELSRRLPRPAGMTHEFQWCVYLEPKLEVFDQLEW